jgi:hypothetical protein
MLPDLPGPDEEAGPVRPRDPVYLAASLLLGRALHTAGTTMAQAARDGVVVIIALRAAVWTLPVYDHWQREARAGARPEDGFRTTYEPFYDPDAAVWVSWAPTEPPSIDQFALGAEVFADAVAAGRHCVGMAADLTWLPQDLVHSADVCLTMPALTGADVGLLARMLCGEDANTSFADDHAALLTPRLLRLARRPDQSADAYLAKLRALLERDRPTAAHPATAGSASIRDTPRLERLHGMDAAVSWGLTLADELQRVRQGQLAWEAVDRGLLLSGPPGSGKTLFARALAATCEVPLITGSYHAWLGSGTGHQGDLLKAMRATFETARKAAPAILFIDEIDSFPDRGTVRHHYAEWEVQVVNALLAEIDGVEGREGVVLIAACNHPNRLDPALVRSGRLDRHIQVRHPDPSALVGILREHLGQDLAGQDLWPAALAAAGASGADAERLVRGARRRARRAGRTLLMDDLLAEIGDGDQRSPGDLRIAALHEAGHAVACLTLRVGALTAVSLRAAGGRGGVTLTSGTGRCLMASDIRHRLIVRLAGRASEEVLVGQATAGAGGDFDSDLAGATHLATLAVTALGLDPETGLVWSGAPTAVTLPEMLRQDSGLAARVRQVLDAAYAEALGLIRQHAVAVQALAAALLERGALAGAEAAAIVARHAALAPEQS